MRSLIDEDLPRATAELIREFGHDAIDVRDIGLRGAKDAEIVSYATKRSRCLITGDYDFADIRNYPPSRHAGIVVVHVRRSAVAASILEMLEAFLERTELVSHLTGRLAIIEPGRVRIRR